MFGMGRYHVNCQILALAPPTPTPLLICCVLEPCCLIQLAPLIPSLYNGAGLLSQLEDSTIHCLPPSPFVKYLWLQSPPPHLLCFRALLSNTAGSTDTPHLQWCLVQAHCHRQLGMDYRTPLGSTIIQKRYTCGWHGDPQDLAFNVLILAVCMI